MVRTDLEGSLSSFEMLVLDKISCSFTIMQVKLLKGIQYGQAGMN